MESGFTMLLHSLLLGILIYLFMISSGSGCGAANSCSISDIGMVASKETMSFRTEFWTLEKRRCADWQRGFISIILFRLRVEVSS